MKTYIQLLLLCIGFALQGQTKTFKNLNEVKASTNRIANAFVNKNYESLFNGMKPYWGLKSSEIDSLTIKTRNYQEFFDQRLGKGISAIKVKEQNLENVLFKESYILQYEKSALRIVMVYYKNNLGWVINYFNWDDKFLEELD